MIPVASASALWEGDGGIFKGGVEILKQRMLRVFFGEEGFRWVYLPVDGEGLVLDGEASVGFGVVVVVAFVLEDGYVA